MHVVRYLQRESKTFETNCTTARGVADAQNGTHIRVQGYTPSPLSAL